MPNAVQYTPRFARDQTLSLPVSPLKSTMPLPGELSPGGGDFIPQAPRVPRRGDGGARQKRAILKPNGAGLNKQVALQRRKLQGSRLRGRVGLEFALKVEYERNQCEQSIFHVEKVPESSVLQLNFQRRGVMNRLEAQPFSYEVDISVPKFKELMDTATFAKMGIWFTKMRPSPNVQTALRAMAQSKGGSRSSTGENARMRRHILKLHKDMQKATFMNKAKTFQLSCDDGYDKGNAMSTNTGKFQPYADLNEGFVFAS
jgi:hypothetical protein